VNANVIGVVVNVKVVDAVVEPEVPVTVMTALVTIAAVDEAEIAAVTWHGVVGVHGLLVNNTVTPAGRVDSETVTGKATPVRVVTVTISLPEAP
jgi:uncharacterized membrane-anchored protein